MSTRLTRLACLLLTLVVALGAIPFAASAETANEPMTIRWYSESRDLDLSKDRVMKAIQDKFNVTFEFIEPPSDGSADKLNLLVSTGEQLDWITAFDVDQVAYQWASDDFIYSYDELLEGKDYPLIKKLVSADLYKNLLVNGKSYFKPQSLWAGNRGYVINQDWLDKLGLAMPTTLDEFYEVIKAFKTGDPDGNGQDDTYGFFVAEPVGYNSFGYIARAFGNNTGSASDWFEQADGTVTQFGLTEEAREAYRFIAKCYDEDLFNKNFVNEIDTYGKVEDLFLQEKIGITDLSQPATLIGKMAEAGKQINISYLPPLTVNGQPGTLPHSGGYWSFHMIPRTCQNPDRVLEILEWALTEEGRALTMFGLEGIHYNGSKMIGETRVFDVNKEAMSEDWNTSDYGFIHPLSWGGFNYCENAFIPIAAYDTFDEAYAHMQRWVDYDPTGTLMETWMTNNASYAKMTALQGVIAEAVQVPETLKDIQKTGRTKAIVGGSANFDANWDEWVNLYMSQGGTALMESANAYYAEHK